MATEKNPLCLVPPPTRTEVSGGNFLWQTSMMVDIPASSDIQLEKWLHDILGIQHSDSANVSFLMAFDSDVENNEAYMLLVEPEKIIVTASNVVGFFYALQTLRQLRHSHKDTIPCCSIEDVPQFKWRGLMLDSVRHFTSVEMTLKLLDLLAYHKINRFHWHLTDDQGWRIPIDTYPKLTEVGAWRELRDDEKDLCTSQRYGGFYSKQDVQTIVRRADELEIMIVPEIELPGHACAALACYPYLGCFNNIHNVPNQWGIFLDIYCAGRETTFEFLEKVFDEVCTMFPNSPYIHIGGDEVPKDRWNNCPKCQERMRKENINAEQLQHWFIDRIGRFLKKRGKTIVGWDEILDGGIVESAIIQSWRGFDGAKEAVKHGHQAIVSPTSHCYFDYPVMTTDIQKTYSFDPIPSGLLQHQKALILGGECCMWTERAPEPTLLNKIFPRILALATCLWTGETHKPSFSEFIHNVRTVHIPHRLSHFQVCCSDGTAIPRKPLLPCHISTTMGQWENYAPGFAFDGDLATYYWSNRCPIAGVHFDIKFAPTLSQGRWHVKITTGKPMDPEHDQLQQAKVFLETESGEIELGSLINGTIDCGVKVDTSIRGLVIQATGSQQEWVVIQNIFLAQCK